MIILPPYIYDRDIYAQLPQSDKIYMNKLWLAEQLGYTCGPSGTDAPSGTYCVRSVMNMYGGGEGGFYKHVADAWDTFRVPNHPGYFWCEWFDGPMKYTEYINDVPTSTIEGNQVSDTRWDVKYTSNHIIIPEFVKDKSRYLLLEAIGDKVIEVSFRHMPGAARQETIDDYRTIDPNYEPGDVILKPYTHWFKELAPPFKVRGYKWVDVPDEDR